MVRLNIGQPMSLPHTRERLTQDLVALGVERGDVLFVHSSFKSLGTVEGGAATVVAALEDALGAAGLLLMPSFNLVEPEKRAAIWNPATTPSTVGWLTEFFRRLPGTVRSDHYSHSVAARGQGSEEFVSGHRSQEGFVSPWDKEPWGRTYGAYSPFLKLIGADGKVLMLGVGYKSCTFMHVVEVMDWNRRLARDPQAKYFYLDRDRLGAYWDTLGKQRRGTVGDADCRLWRAREFVHTLLAVVEQEPQKYFKYYP